MWVCIAQYFTDATLRLIVTALICMYIRACTVLAYRNKITDKYANKSNRPVYACCVHVSTCTLVLYVRKIKVHLRKIKVHQEKRRNKVVFLEKMNENRI